MNIKECVDFLNFWIRKERGAFYTIDESVSVIDRAQIAYFNDIVSKYATSQIVKDTLIPFKEKYNFNIGDTPSGIVTVPNRFLYPFTMSATNTSSGNIIEVTSAIPESLGKYLEVDTTTGGIGVFQPGTYVVKIIDSTHIQVNIEPLVPLQSGDIINIYTVKEFLDLLDVTVVNGANYFSIKMTNEDELADKLNSQINPPIQSAPVGEYIGLGEIQLYPQINSYDGFVQYLRRPQMPIYGYDVVGGRSIVYNPSQSIQLEWRDNDVNAILLKALASEGINLSDQEVSQFAQIKSQENYQGVNHL